MWHRSAAYRMDEEVAPPLHRQPQDALEPFRCGCCVTHATNGSVDGLLVLTLEDSG